MKPMRIPIAENMSIYIIG